ncbi:hypothetical protein GIB67_006083, partial [Kingdonia uniflora]
MLRIICSKGDNCLRPERGKIITNLEYDHELCERSTKNVTCENPNSRSRRGT